MARGRIMTYLWSLKDTQMWLPFAWIIGKILQRDLYRSWDRLIAKSVALRRQRGDA